MPENFDKIIREDWSIFFKFAAVGFVATGASRFLAGLAGDPTPRIKILAFLILAFSAIFSMFFAKVRKQIDPRAEVWPYAPIATLLGTVPVILLIVLV